MLKYFERLTRRLDAAISKSSDLHNARRKFALEVARIGTRLYSGEHRVAWCGVVAPFDMLAAMNLTSCFVEFVGAMLSSTGAVGTFLEESEHAGFARGHVRVSSVSARRGNSKGYAAPRRDDCDHLPMHRRTSCNGKPRPHVRQGAVRA